MFSAFCFGAINCSPSNDENEIKPIPKDWANKTFKYQHTLHLAKALVNISSM